MRLKKVNSRYLEVRQDGWFWDSQITPELTKYILPLKEGEEVELKTKNGSLWLIREEEEKFFVESEEHDEEFGTWNSRFVLWQSDLERVSSSPKRKLTKETLHTAVNAPLNKKSRSSIRAFKKALRRAKARSCYLSGFTEIWGVTSNSGKKFLFERGFWISPEGELFHPRGRKSTAEKVSQYKSDKLLEKFGLL